MLIMKLKLTRTFKKSTFVITTLGSLGVLLGASLTGYELAGSSSPAQASSGSNSITLSAKSIRPIHKRTHRHPYQVVSSYYLKKKGTTVVVTRDYGLYVAVSPSQVTLELPTGKEVTFSVAPGTKFRGLSLSTLESDLSRHVPVRGLTVTVGTQLKAIRSHVAKATALPQTSA